MSELNIPHAPYAIFKKPFKKPKIAQLTKNYSFNGNSLGDVPNDLLYLLETIEKSKYILDLQDDWDDAGSEGYGELSWTASVKFLLKYAKTLHQDFNIEVQTPNIYPGPKGSIDILWKVETYRLLVNIGKNGEDAMFYADNYKDQTTEGNFKIDQFNRFLLPIAIKF
jgi:hypothetical protein